MTKNGLIFYSVVYRESRQISSLKIEICYHLFFCVVIISYSTKNNDYNHDNRGGQ